MQKYFAIVMAGLAFSSCVTARPDAPLTPRPPDAAPPQVRIGTAHGDVVSLGLEEYVTGTILAEAALGGLDHETAMRVAQVQAVLARTYALANRRRHAHEAYDLCSTTHCQVYRPELPAPDRLSQIVRDAVRSTEGVVVTLDGAPINAVFHADCGGHTSDASAVWLGATPSYLVGLPDAYCRRPPRDAWQFEITESALAETMVASGETGLGRRLERIVVTERDAAGRAVSIILDGAQPAIVRGERLRAAIVARHGARSLKSTRFTVQRSGDRFIFTGHGFGHGVGLCQTGARTRAEAGHSPREILQHYYPGTTLKRLPTGLRHTQ